LYDACRGRWQQGHGVWPTGNFDGQLREAKEMAGGPRTPVNCDFDKQQMTR